MLGQQLQVFVLLCRFENHLQLFIVFLSGCLFHHPKQPANHIVCINLLRDERRMHVLVTTRVDKIRILEQEFLEAGVGEIGQRIILLVQVNHFSQYPCIFIQVPWICSVIESILTKHFRGTGDRYCLVLLIDFVKSVKLCNNTDRLLLVRDKRVPLKQMLIHLSILSKKQVVLFDLRRLLPVQVVIKCGWQILSCRQPRRWLPGAFDIQHAVISVSVFVYRHF